MVLWLLILRAAGIELRHQLDNPMWHSFWDFCFFGSSVLLAIFFGAALGNVVRGVPLNADGYFFEPLWTTFTVTDQPGILDWFTVLSGVVALVALAVHGSAYLAVKTSGELNTRSRSAIAKLWYVMVLVTLLSLIGVMNLRQGILDNYSHYPIGWAIPVLVVASLASIKIFNGKGLDKGAFLASSIYLAMMLVGAVFALYPNVLPAMNPAYSLTIENASAGSYGLSVGLIWWTIGIIIAIGYFVFVYRTFGGKVGIGDEASSSQVE